MSVIHRVSWYVRFHALHYQRVRICSAPLARYDAMLEVQYLNDIRSHFFPTCSCQAYMCNRFVCIVATAGSLRDREISQGATINPSTHPSINQRAMYICTSSWIPKYGVHICEVHRTWVRRNANNVGEIIPCFGYFFSYISAMKGNEKKRPEVNQYWVSICQEAYTESVLTVGRISTRDSCFQSMLSRGIGSP